MTHTATPAKTTKKRRYFLWFFLVVQILFIVMLVTGAASVSGGPTDCGTLDPKSCKDAHDVGSTIGVGLLVGLWMATDVILGISYGIFRLTRRSGRGSG